LGTSGQWVAEKMLQQKVVQRAPVNNPSLTRNNVRNRQAFVDFVFQMGLAAKDPVAEMIEGAKLHPKVFKTVSWQSGGGSGSGSSGSSSSSSSSNPVPIFPDPPPPAHTHTLRRVPTRS
jgi:hypothetical protein